MATTASVKNTIRSAVSPPGRSVVSSMRAER